ncbi:DUF881 domain-containing protein [Trujillonella endophytica]|uniref:Uncharacterized conserved protein YlxW, UPF0749 family n=1 Tax=Trujillonella endophytica TaxID=673521 RepID=A0A1H8T5L6_9ACTN|nr:DUF881 domain-containing protein [Trujillella endophytica]SEO86221.1 Uncharacterized conserved protein YlxW, UPF0749 family [Trujillella endophytica]
MTTATPGSGGLRSAGASLLDQVLAETLDPAYTRAAREREGRPEPGPGRRRAGQVAVALVMVAAGLLAAVTYHLTAAGAEGRQEIRAALVDDIGDAEDVSDALVADLEQARADVDSAREAALAASDEGQEALRALDEAEQMAGTVPVTGPGLLVTLADAEADAEDDPVGGDAEPDPRNRIRDDDIQVVVNALWVAGAEAVSINGQRLSPTTAIRFAGEAVLVDFRPVTNPYEISAIGDPDTLRSRFLTVPEVIALAGASDSFGLRFDFGERESLSLPAGRTPELRSATAVPDGAPAGSTPVPGTVPPGTELPADPGAGPTGGTPRPTPEADP